MSDHEARAREVWDRCVPFGPETVERFIVEALAAVERETREDCAKKATELAPYSRDKWGDEGDWLKLFKAQS